MKNPGTIVHGTSPFARAALPAMHYDFCQRFVLNIILVGILASAPSLASQLQPVQNAGNTLATGTRLYVQLLTSVSTKTSHLHQAVTARVVREVTTDQGVWVPIGAEVKGTIEKLIPSSDPADHARLLIRFDKLEIPGHAALELTSHLTGIENARETVLQDGTIQGVLAKDVPVSRVGGTLDKMGSAGGQMQKVSDKALGKADNSIDYPIGTDINLALDTPLLVDSTSPSAAAMQLSPALAETVQKLLADAPQCVEGRNKKPGDPLNLIFVGGAGQLTEAFKVAGWGQAKKLNVKSAAGTLRSITSKEGYGEAPVSQLYLYGRAEDMAFEKMLNTFSKRHHLRVWLAPVATPDGRDIWLSAATHDVGIDIHPGVVSHAIDSNLDAERAKVGADLMASGLVASEQLVDRPNPITEGRTATGATWRTNGQLLVIELKPSSAP